MSHEDLALRAAALKVFADHFLARYNEVRVELDAAMQRGDRWMARSPHGTKLAAVSKSDPKPTARITDEAAFHAWIAEHYPERMVTDYLVIGSDREVVDVLFEHAPHLLRKVAAPDPELVKEIRTASASLGTPIGPGGEVDLAGIEVPEPAGVVSCKPAEGALETVVELIRSEALTFEQLMLPALPGGEN